MKVSETAHDDERESPENDDGGDADSNVQYNDHDQRGEPGTGEFQSGDELAGTVSP